MKDERKGGAFVPANYPALRESLPGYLHEDFQETSGTVAEAMEAFLVETWTFLHYVAPATGLVYLILIQCARHMRLCRPPSAHASSTESRCRRCRGRADSDS